MAQVTLKINGYAHTLACADGEEEHLRAMGAALDERIAAMKKAGVQGSEARMLLMAALMVSDELTDAKTEVARLNAEMARAVAQPDVKARLDQLASFPSDGVMTPEACTEFVARFAAECTAISKEAGVVAQ